MKDIWSENERDDADHSFFSALSSLFWTSALLSFDKKEPFSITRRIVEGQDQLVVSTIPDDGLDQWVFDAITGDLLSFNGSGEDSFEIHWLQNEFDRALADSVFEWKAPEGATKVAPEAMEMKIKM